MGSLLDYRGVTTSRLIMTLRSSVLSMLPVMFTVMAAMIAAIIATEAPALAQGMPLPGTGPGSGPAYDQDQDPDRDQDVERAARNRINLRLGTASTDANGRPTICMEVLAVWQLSIESCGTGTGILHNEAGGELAHFRAKWAVGSLVAYQGLLRLQGGIGFAELALDTDELGFEFGSPTGPRIEAAGPEAAVSVQWLRPLGGGWDFIANTTAGMAWIPYAGELAVPQSQAQPFVSFEAGIGW